MRNVGIAFLDRYPFSVITDNDEVLYRVRKLPSAGIEAGRAEKELVTKGVVRGMFIKFVQNSPELQNVPREEQIREFNLSRQEARQSPLDPGIFLDLLVPDVREI